MSDYSYFSGDGVSRLNQTTPVGNQEAGTILDDAIRQIKSYLKDSSVGPDALISQLLADIAAVMVPAGSVPTGLLFLNGNPTVPDGYLQCDGQQALIASYPDLAALLGTTFGVAPSGYFKLPDFRSRSPRGRKSGGLVALGDYAGFVTHSLTEAELASHTHSLPDGFKTVTLLGANNAANYYNIDKITQSIASTATVNGEPHDNVQPTVCLPIIIKT